jgi:hypothetical protein
MSYEQLEQQELLLPEQHWGEAELSSSASLWLVALAGALAGLAIALMVLGRGGVVTWLGVGLFIAFLYGYALLSSLAIDAQNRRIEKLLKGRRGRRALPGA